MKTGYFSYIILTGALGTMMFASCHSDKNSAAEAVPEVVVATPMVDSVVLRQKYPATIEATDKADVVARVNGQILKQCYENGQFVNAGQTLFIIESGTYRDAVNEAQAALETAIAKKEFASKQYEAMQRAIEADAVSKMDLIQAESNLRQSEAAIKSARAQLETARTQLGYCTVRAPFSGKVSKALLSPGAYVSGEAAPVTLCSVYDDRKLYVNFSVATDRYLTMKDTRVGRAVDYDNIPVVFGDSIAGTYYGKLIYTSPDVSTSTGTVGLRLLLDNSKGELHDGMYASVSLPYATQAKAIVIKDAAISTDQLGKFVYTVNDSNRVVYTPIQIGELYQDTLRIVNDGLTPESRYVTTALLKVRDGMEVKPVTASTSQR